MSLGSPSPLSGAWGSEAETRFRVLIAVRLSLLLGFPGGASTSTLTPQGSPNSPAFLAITPTASCLAPISCWMSLWDQSMGALFLVCVVSPQCWVPLLRP